MPRLRAARPVSKRGTRGAEMAGRSRGAVRLRPAHRDKTSKAECADDLLRIPKEQRPIRALRAPGLATTHQAIGSRLQAGSRTPRQGFAQTPVASLGFAFLHSSDLTHAMAFGPPHVSPSPTRSG